MKLVKTGNNLKKGDNLLYWYTPTPIRWLGKRFFYKTINRYYRVAYFNSRPSMTIVEDDTYTVII